MLSKKQIKEIQEHLDNAQNPLFFFDNDPDGLCAFLLLQRKLERGKGFPIRSFPDLTETYFRKVKELNSDYIFILDKPGVSIEFLNEARENNIPVVWIDHHEKPDKKLLKFENVFYFNSKKGEPTTFLCNQVTNKKEDLWLVLIGCIYDRFLPDFYKTVKKEFEDILIDTEEPFDIYYKTEFGKIIRMFNAGLRDSTTNVINFMKFLRKVKSPYAILKEERALSSVLIKFNYLESRINSLVEKAKKNLDDSNLILLEYSGDLSASSEVSNKLYYLYPNKYTVALYVSQGKVNISARGKNVRKILSKCIRGFDGAVGGGHKNAVGGRMSTSDLEEFKKRLKKLVK